MSNLEHYFENLLFEGHDTKDNCNTRPAPQVREVPVGEWAT